MADDRRRIIDEFDEAVNMSPEELEEWLQTDGGGESKGNRSGRRIVEIRRKNKPEYTDDVAHMRRVVSYVHRHEGRRGGQRLAPLSNELGTRPAEVAPHISARLRLGRRDLPNSLGVILGALTMLALTCEGA